MPMIPPKARLWLRRSHLIVALLAGLISAFVGLTGAIWAFHGEAEVAARPERQLAPHAPGAPLKLEALLQASRDAGATAGPAELEVGPAPDAAWRLFLQDRTVWLVDPYAGKLFMRRDAAADWGEWVLRGHRFLGLGHDLGEGLTGYSSLGLVFLGISGLVIWLPRRKANLHQFHGWVGALAMVGMISSAATGVAFAFGDTTKTALSWATGTASDVPRASQAAKAPARFGPEALLATAQARFPDAQVKAIRWPNQEGRPFRVTLRRADEPQLKGRCFAYVDPSSNQLLGATDPQSAPLAWRLYYVWVLPLHTGEAWGLPGRAFMAACSLAPLALSVSGLWLWLRRRRMLKASKARAAARAAAQAAKAQAKPEGPPTAGAPDATPPSPTPVG